MAISITKPTVNGSNNTWGDTINTALDTIVDGINGAAGEIAPDLTQGSWKIGGTAVTSTAAELNVLDGDTSATSTTLEDADRLLVNDNGVMKQVAFSDLGGYISAQSYHPTISAASSVNNSGDTVIQDITLDDNGHVTGLTSTTISVDTSGDIAGQSAGAVGTYLFARWYGTAVSFGGTIAGSSLTPAGIYGGTTSTTGGAANTDFGGGTRSGTWRCMGHTSVSGTSTTTRMSLFLRIS